MACLSKQPPWRAAGDPRPARSRSRVPAPGPAGALRALFFSTLPSFLLQEMGFFRTFPTKPTKVLGIYYTLLAGCTISPLLYITKSHKKLSPKHAARGVAISPYPIYRQGKACLSKQPPWRAAADPRPARGRSWGSSPGPGGRAARAFFSTLPSFLILEMGFFAPSPTSPRKC